MRKAIVFIKIFSKYMLPKSTIQEIVGTTLSIHNLKLDFKFMTHR